MRLRNNPKALDIMKENTHLVVVDPRNYKGKWCEIFDNNNPIYIEIGMGKGDFIYQHALNNPHINYVGIEKYPSVLASAINKMKIKDKVSNLRLITFDAIELNDIFEKDELDLIYLNFSDPWPKSRHEKRRLTSATFLDVYKNNLKAKGSIEFKTDNRGLFEYSLTSFNNYLMKFKYVSLDLHNSEYFEENVMTEYEQKFCIKGPIYKLVAKF